MKSWWCSDFLAVRVGRTRSSPPGTRLVAGTEETHTQGSSGEERFQGNSSLEV